MSARIVTADTANFLASSEMSLKRLTISGSPGVALLSVALAHPSADFPPRHRSLNSRYQAVFLNFFQCSLTSAQEAWLEVPNPLVESPPQMVPHRRQSWRGIPPPGVQEPCTEVAGTGCADRADVRAPRGGSSCSAAQSCSPSFATMWVRRLTAGGALIQRRWSDSAASSASSSRKHLPRSSSRSPPGTRRRGVAAGVERNGHAEISRSAEEIRQSQRNAACK
jgi:hypothetical protein